MSNAKPTFASSMKVLKRFESATVEASWAGAGDPADYVAIEREYENAKAAMIETLRRLTK